MSEINWTELLDQAKASGVPLDREPIPAARYPLKIVKAEAGVSGQGNTNYKVTAEVQAGPHAGRYIFENITLSEKTVGYFFRKMNALGADEAYFRQQPAPSPHQVADKITGAFFEGDVSIEPAKGTYAAKNRIDKWYRPNAGGAPTVGGPAPQAYSQPAAPAYAAPAPAAPPQAAPAPAQAPAAPAVDPWGAAPAAAPQAAPAAAPWETQGAAPAAAPAPAPAPQAPWA